MANAVKPFFSPETKIFVANGNPPQNPVPTPQVIAAQRNG